MAYRAPPKVISKAMKLAETPRYLKQKAKGSKLVNDKVLKNNMLQQKKEPQQLYMPSIFMKLVRPGPTANGVPRPKNVALFHVPQTMTKFDIKNYLEKIYQMDIAKVHTANQLGKTKRDQLTGKTYKRPDIKKAYVYLANQDFEFPELYREEPPPPPPAPTQGVQEAPVDEAEAKIQQAQANEMMI